MNQQIDLEELLGSGRAVLDRPAAQECMTLLALPGVVTETSWQPPADLSFEQWLQCMRWLFAVERRCMW